jgi:hypothetical protein
MIYEALSVYRTVNLVLCLGLFPACLSYNEVIDTVNIVGTGATMAMLSGSSFPNSRAYARLESGKLYSPSTCQADAPYLKAGVFFEKGLFSKGILFFSLWSPR